MHNTATAQLMHEQQQNNSQKFEPVKVEEVPFLSQHIIQSFALEQAQHIGAVFLKPK